MDYRRLGEVYVGRPPEAGPDPEWGDDAGDWDAADTPVLDGILCVCGGVVILLAAVAAVWFLG